MCSGFDPRFFAEITEFRRVHVAQNRERWEKMSNLASSHIFLQKVAKLVKIGLTLAAISPETHNIVTISISPVGGKIRPTKNDVTVFFQGRRGITFYDASY